MRLRYQVISVVAGLSLAGCLSTAPADLPEDEFGEVGMSLRKGSGGVSGNDVDFCNDPAFPCVLGESDCDSNAQCEGALVCGLDNGPQFGHPFAWDSCVPVHCTNGVQDADETVTDCGGADCGTECGGVCGDVEPSPGAAACTNKCPCTAGESDCDADSQCAAGLVCGLNNGPQFGFPDPYDVCVAAHCTNNTQDGDETGMDCGGADCGTCVDACAGMPVNGDPHHCSNDCPCPQGEGDCDSNAQCTGSGICGVDNGAAFGFHPAIDVCIADHCANGVKDGDELDIDCGPSCGDCEGTVTLGVTCHETMWFEDFSTGECILDVDRTYELTPAQIEEQFYFGRSELGWNSQQGTAGYAELFCDCPSCARAGQSLYQLEPEDEPWSATQVSATVVSDHLIDGTDLVFQVRGDYTSNHSMCLFGHDIVCDGFVRLDVSSVLCPPQGTADASCCLEPW